MVSVHARHAGGLGFESPFGRLFPQIKPTLRFGITPWWTYRTYARQNVHHIQLFIDLKTSGQTVPPPPKNGGHCVQVVVSKRPKRSVDKPWVDETTMNQSFQ